MIRKNIEIGIGTTYLKYGYSFDRYSTHVNFDDVFLDRNSGSAVFEMYGAKPYIRTQLSDWISVSMALHVNQPFYARRSQPGLITGLLFYTGTNSSGELDLFGFTIYEKFGLESSPISHSIIPRLV